MSRNAARLRLCELATLMAQADPSLLDVLLSAIPPDKREAALQRALLTGLITAGSPTGPVEGGVGFADIPARTTDPELHELALRIVEAEERERNRTVRRVRSPVCDLLSSGADGVRRIVVVASSASLTGPLRAFWLTDVPALQIDAAHAALAAGDDSFRIDIVANLADLRMVQRVALPARDIVDQHRQPAPCRFRVSLYRYATNAHPDGIVTTDRSDLRAKANRFREQGNIVLTIRFAVGLVALATGCIFAAGHSPSRDATLSYSLMLFGGVMIAQCALDQLWASKRAGSGSVADREAAVRDLVSLIITAAGIILALLTVFGADALTTTLKVAVGALATSIITGVLAFSYFIPGARDEDPTRRRRQSMIRLLLLNVVLAGLVLGVACIGLALIRRNVQSPPSKSKPVRSASQFGDRRSSNGRTDRRRESGSVLVSVGVGGRDRVGGGARSRPQRG